MPLNEDQYSILKKSHRIRIVVGLIIVLAIAAIHAFRAGSYLSGKAYILYYSYASDIMMPFAIYFMLCINEIHLSLLREWYSKVLIVFGLASFSEIMQYFGIYFFGTTFDWIDILMFGTGSLLAAFLDRQIFEKLLKNWKYKPAYL